jgi:hypothetical protein
LKKFIIMSVAALGLSTVSSAATILCTPSNQNTITNTVITSPFNGLNCGTVNATPGMEITSIALQLVGGFNDAVPGSTSQLQFTATNSFNAATVTGTTGVDDFTSNTGLQLGSGVAVANLTTLGAVTASVTTTSLGAAIPDNASVTVWLVTTERTIQTPTVPEPSTFALLGAALTGLGVYSRRRKA